MIVKKFKHQKNTKPKAQQIADIVDYIRQPHDMNPAHKIEHSGGLNFLTGTHDAQRKEMIALASESVYSKMPVSHYVFSWREGEQPTAQQVDDLVDVFLKELGLEGCQTVYALHYNTNNYHAHIAVNRMHPDTMKVINPGKGFDIIAAHKVLALVEHRQGWQPEAKSLFVISEAGEAVRRRKPKQIKPTPAALDFECATGEKSAQRIAQERGHRIIREAKSWPELHDKLDAVGLRFEKKGSGAILFVGDIAVKASSVDRAFSMGKLCKRLGEFEPSVYPIKKAKMEPEPISFINKEEWERYQYVKSLPVMTDPSMSLLRDRQRRERESLPSRLRQALPYPPLGAAPGQIRTCPRPILNIARHLQKRQHQKERRRLRQRPQGWVYRPSPGSLRFEDWLRYRGLNDQAEHWRHRRRLKNIPSALWEAPSLPDTQTGDACDAYAAHRQAILQNNPDMECSPSILDAHIALHMRENGFSREVIVDAIQHCAPEHAPEQEDRNWQRYAERAADHAFGIPGDLWLARRAEEWQQEQEKQEADARREEEVPREAPREVPRMRLR